MSQEFVIYEADGSERKIERKSGPPTVIVISFVVVIVATIVASFARPDSPKQKSNKTSDAQPSGTPAPCTGNIASAGYMSYVPDAAYLKAREDYEQHEQEIQEKRKAGKEAVWNRRPILAAPEDAPPSPIRVGPFNYSVNYTSAKALLAHDALAETFLEYREIWLNPDRHGNLRADLLHELLHCAIHLGNADGRLSGQQGGEENFVEAAQPGLLQILQDNPALREWISQREGPQ